MQLAGWELTGQNNDDYTVIYGERTLSANAQRSFDEKARTYIREYRSLRPEFVIDPIADVPGFGDSYITQGESDQIVEIMRIKTDGLWNVVFYDEEPPEGSDTANVNSGGGFGDMSGSRRLQDGSTIVWPKYDNLQPEQKKILHKAGLELMGNEYFGAYLIGQNVGSDAI